MNSVIASLQLPLPPVHHNALLNWAQDLTRALRNHAADVTNQINSGAQGSGADLASADTIEPSAALHRVTGTNTVNTIKIPASFSGDLRLYSVDGFSFGTAGNIATSTTFQIPSGQYAHIVYNAPKKLWHVDKGPLSNQPGGFNSHTVLLGEGSGVVGQAGPLSNGQLLIGSSGSDPAAAALATGAGISSTTGAGSLQINNTGVLSAAGTANQVLINGGTGAVNGAVTASLPAVISGPTRIAGLNAPTANKDALSEGNPIGGVQPAAVSGTIVTWKQPAGTLNAMTYGASMTPDLSQGDIVTITATDGSAFTINNPNNPITGQRWLLKIFNNSGGTLGAVSWGAAFRQLAAIATPANGKSRWFEMIYDGSFHNMVWESGSDVG